MEKLVRSNSTSNLAEVNKHLIKSNHSFFYNPKGNNKPIQSKRSLFEILQQGYRSKKPVKLEEIGSSSTRSRRTKGNALIKDEDEVGDDWFKEKDKEVIRIKIARRIKRFVRGSGEESRNRQGLKLMVPTTSNSSSVESLALTSNNPLIRFNSLTPSPTPTSPQFLPSPLLTPIQSHSSLNPTPTFNSGSLTPLRTLTLQNASFKASNSPSKLFQSRFGKILSNSNSSTAGSRRDSLDESIVQEEEKEDKYVYEILYEHQRGAFLFKKARFSSAALNQLDPKTWTDEHRRDSPYTPLDFPLPSLFHQWDHPQWLIDMTGDVDEQGWTYSCLFHSNHWSGQPSQWFSFVRRRRWIRGRLYLPPLPSSHPHSRHFKYTSPPPPTQIDWSPSLPFPTPNDGSQINQEIKSGELPTSSTGLKTACSLLPLEPQSKDNVFNWSNVVLGARNPFLSYVWVKKEGEGMIQSIREDRMKQREERKKVGLEDQGGSGIERSEELLMGVWRDAVVEINYRRVNRVLKSLCRVDREKLDLWGWWMIKEGEGEGDEVEVVVPECVNSLTEQGKQYKEMKGSNGKSKPDIEDVWNLVEGRLDLILSQFEFQSNRFKFLHLILSRHPLSHSQHRYKNFDQPFQFLPEELVVERNGRKLSFWSDVEELRKTLEGGEASV